MITLIARLCSAVGISSWRQSSYNIKKIKKIFRKAQNLKRSNSKDAVKKSKREKLIIKAHQAYIALVSSFLEKAEKTINTLRKKQLCEVEKIQEIEKYIKHAKRQINQIQRRVVDGEIIAHDEKVFSVFEEHTEWISKGKAGVPQELGLKVCILEDQFGFILHHQVMENQIDKEVAVPMIETAKQKFPNLNSCSFDKGFYTPDNKVELAQLLDRVILPKKGKLSEKDKQVEHSEEFIQSKHQHSAVESGINALENHSLDRCPDHGIDGFKRYVALAVLARNIQILGHIIQQKQLKQLQGREKLKLRSAA